MYTYKIILLAVILYTCSVKNEVLELSNTNFRSTLEQFELSMVLFYYQFCDNCNKVLPEYEKAASYLMAQNPPIRLAKVECMDAVNDVCNTEEIEKNPILEVFRKGEFLHRYDGIQESFAIVNHMKAISGSLSSELGSIQDFENFIDLNEKWCCVVGFFEADTPEKSNFFNMVSKFEGNLYYAHSTTKEVLEHLGLDNHVALFRPKYLHNKFEENYVLFNESDGDFENFIKNNKHGLVGHRTIENQNEFEYPLIIAYFSIDYEKDPKGTNYWRNRILKVGKIYKGQFNFAMSSKQHYDFDLKVIGINVTGEAPIIVAQHASDGEKFILKEKFSIKAFDEFINAIIDGKYKPYRKSQPVPKINDKAVKIAVADNFDEIVTNNGKDTLIAFYASWCTHCRQAEPTYHKLGEILKNEDIVVVKIDANENDVPKIFEVNGYPTLYWVPKNRNDAPIRYEGQHTLEEFSKFISEHSSIDLINLVNAETYKDEL